MASFLFIRMLHEKNKSLAKYKAVPKAAAAWRLCRKQAGEELVGWSDVDQRLGYKKEQQEEKKGSGGGHWTEQTTVATKNKNKNERPPLQIGTIVLCVEAKG